MERDDEKRRILRILADDWDRNPSNRSGGIHFRRLGALVGAYLNYPLYSIAELKSEGLVSQIGNSVLLTDKGYSYIRGHSYIRQGAIMGMSWFNLGNPWVYLLLTVVAGLAVGLILLFVKL